MLIGFVSDERYVALSDVMLEFVDVRGASFETRSRASGSVHLDLPSGEYVVTLQRPGFGGKRVRLNLPAPQPHQFRMLSDGLLGYAWPKCVREKTSQRPMPSSMLCTMSSSAVSTAWT